MFAICSVADICKCDEPTIDRKKQLMLPTPDTKLSDSGNFLRLLHM
jgi:hypothetical protein